VSYDSEEAAASFQAYASAFAEHGLEHVFAPHLLKMWLVGVPAEYAVATLKARGRVSEVIRMWEENIPLEYASAT
jgi:hypothetical protein